MRAKSHTRRTRDEERNSTLIVFKFRSLEKELSNFPKVQCPFPPSETYLTILKLTGSKQVYLSLAPTTTVTPESCMMYVAPSSCLCGELFVRHDEPFKVFLIVSIPAMSTSSSPKYQMTTESPLTPLFSRSTARPKPRPAPAGPAPRPTRSPAQLCGPALGLRPRLYLSVPSPTLQLRRRGQRGSRTRLSRRQHLQIGSRLQLWEPRRIKRVGRRPIRLPHPRRRDGEDRD